LEPDAVKVSEERLILLVDLLCFIKLLLTLIEEQGLAHKMSETFKELALELCSYFIARIFA
jgi:hypothetical protein